jgi:hypothetical protein
MIARGDGAVVMDQTSVKRLACGSTHPRRGRNQVVKHQKIQQFQILIKNGVFQQSSYDGRAKRAAVLVVT